MSKVITKEKMEQQIEAVRKFAEIMGYTVEESTNGKVLYMDLLGTHDSEDNEYGWYWVLEENGYSGPYTCE